MNTTDALLIRDRVCEQCSRQESTGTVLNWYIVNGSTMLLCEWCAKALENKNG